MAPLDGAVVGSIPEFAGDQESTLSGFGIQQAGE